MNCSRNFGEEFQSESGDAESSVQSEKCRDSK